VVDRGALGAVELALEVDALLAPEAADQAHRLRQPLPPLLCPRPLLPGGGRLVHRLPGADAEEDASGEERPERAERLRDDRGVVAHRRREHAGAEVGAVERLAGRAEPDDRIRRVAAVVAPGLEVVGDGDGVEADALGVPREVEQLARAELLGRSLVAVAHQTAILLLAKRPATSSRSGPPPASARRRVTSSGESRSTAVPGRSTRTASS